MAVRVAELLDALLSVSRGQPSMHLVKPRLDIGLNTNNLEPLLAFWQRDAGIPFDQLLPIGRGVKQYRHDVNGSVLKINHHREPLPDTPPAGYVALLVAREAVREPMTMSDPDGNAVVLVPPGHCGIAQIAIKLHVRDLAAHRKFYAEALGLTEEAYVPGAAFRAGETLLLVEQAEDAPEDAVFLGKGWRYITFQVRKTDEEHARVLAQGGREALAPRTLGEVARISMVRDPDGNFIELSQRASLTGTLEA